MKQHLMLTDSEKCRVGSCL